MPGVRFGVADDYMFCPHCGRNLIGGVRMLTERFRKLAERL